MYINTCNCMVFDPLNKYIVEAYIYLKKTCLDFLIGIKPSYGL